MNYSENMKVRVTWNIIFPLIPTDCFVENRTDQNKVHMIPPNNTFQSQV